MSKNINSLGHDKPYIQSVANLHINSKILKISIINVKKANKFFNIKSKSEQKEYERLSLLAHVIRFLSSREKSSHVPI